MLKQLLSIKPNNTSKKLKIKEKNISALIKEATAVFKKEPIFLEIMPPVKICGDIHGQFSDLLKVFKLCGQPSETDYLFLGDYVDRGKQSLETILLLLIYKIKYPKKFHILRGNHESSTINRIYGFYDECKRKYNVKIWKEFSQCFNFLPILAVVDEKIICMHGGLSPELNLLKNLHKIKRPLEVPEEGLLCDILWSDPSYEVETWGENERGVSYIFGEEVVNSFLKKMNMDLICRAHQVVEDGYEFFADQQLITLFTAPNYCGDFDNDGAILTVDKDLICSFQILNSNQF